MDLNDVQQELKSRGLYAGAIDGLMGPGTDAGLEMFFQRSGVHVPETWSDARRVVAAGQLAARGRGIVVGTIDGLAGTQTQHAFAVYAARKGNNWQVVPEVEAWRDKLEQQIASGTVTPPAPSRELASVTTSATAAPSPVPVWPRQSQVEQVFGPRGSSQVYLTLPYPMQIAWDLDKTVTRWLCHTKVRENFERIFKRTLEHYGLDEIRRLRLNLWGGTLNVRLMRGSSSAWSIHSWGCACDIDPEHNALRMSRKQATLDDPAYDPFWRFVYDEGFVGLGRERDYDWMHMQAARL